MSVNGFDDSKNKKEVYTKEEADAVQKEIITITDENYGTIELTFRRNGKVVTVNAKFTAKADVNICALMPTVEVPDFAKVTDTTRLLGKSMTFSGTQLETIGENDYLLISSPVLFVQLSVINSTYKLSMGITRPDKPTEEMSYETSLTYIVD